MTHFKPEQPSFIRNLRLAVLRNMELPSSSDILVRINRYIEAVGDEILHERELSDLQRTGVQRAIAIAPKAIGTLHDLIIDQPLPKETREDLLFCLAQILDDALEIGFYHALDRKAIKTTDRLIQAGQKGGKAGSAPRKAKADAWKKIVDKEIVRIRKDDPYLSQDALAERIRDAWKLENCPGHQSVTKRISAFDKEARAALSNEGGSLRTEGPSST